MNTQEQAYLEGFVKRASEYGFDENEAVNLLKESSFGKMLNRLKKAKPDKFSHAAQQYNREAGFVDQLMTRHPEIRRGADLHALAALGEKDYNGNLIIPQGSKSKSLLASGPAAEALHYQGKLKEIKEDLLERFNDAQYSPGGFLRHAAKERIV